MRRDFHEHMDMFSRQNAGYDLDAQFFAHLPDNRSYPLPQRAFQHLVAILRDPDDVSRATIWMTSRIASPEMLLNINLLPHLICSFWASGGIGGYEAGEHDDTGRRPSRTRGNDSCARGERPHAPLGNQARKAAP